MAAPFAAFMRFNAIEPEASTIKMINDPAFRAIRLARTSPPSMNTPLSSLSVPCDNHSKQEMALIPWVRGCTDLTPHAGCDESFTWHRSGRDRQGNYVLGFNRVVVLPELSIPPPLTTALLRRGRW